MQRTFVETPRLRIAVDQLGPADGRPVLFQHGWPDGPESFAAVARRVADRGYRCVLPTLRGHGETVFKAGDVPRSGQVVALARDIEAVIDWLDATAPQAAHLAGECPREVHLVGHDWGCRAAFAAAILFPQKLRSIVPISLGWQPVPEAAPLPIAQAQAFWYQWWFATPAGAEALKSRPHDVARRMWETWSPPDWFSETDWQQTARAFDNPDWPAVVTHYYRARYGLTELDPAYAADEAAFVAAESIGVACCLIHGAADTCTLPGLSEGMEGVVKAPYERHVLEEVGHFPQREAPEQVAALIVDWIERVDAPGDGSVS